MRVLILILAIFLGSLMNQEAEAQAYGLTQRPTVAPFLDGAMPTTEPVIGTNWSTVVAFPNLTFLNPMGLLPIPGTSKLVVWEREGRVYSFDNVATTASKTLMLDLSNRCQGWDDEGLLGIAFHPNFQSNRYVYLFYNWVSPGTVQGDPNTRPPNNTSTHQRLARFTYNTSTGLLDPASEYIILDQIDHNSWHNGGGMFFHPVNGFLYLTNGNDANGGYDQVITNGLFGCVIRIDVDKRGGSISHAPTRRPNEEVGPNWPNAYYVPNDNPFLGVSGALEEIYALGLRSPHRMTIDVQTQRIFIGDVGEGTFEEIDTIEPNDPAGLNFQWHNIEGYNGDLTAPYYGVNKRPLLDYRHGGDGGNAVIGGYIYRGSEFPELYGKYIFGDNVSSRIWVLDESTRTATTPASKILLTTMPKGPGPSSGADYTGLSSFGYDANNELYLCQLSSVGGRIYKLQRGGPPPGQPIPAKLSETGVFSDLASLTPSDKLIPYALNQPFWSDGARKSRWAVVPNTANVGFTATGEWSWPEGTVLVKHFDLPVDDTNPTVTKRLETRLLVKSSAGSVYGVTYKWRADNSDADLLDSGLTENVPIAIAPVGVLTGSDIGGPAQAGSTTRVGDVVTVTGGGTDIWGNTDQFQFAQQQRTGDFDVFVRIESLNQPDLYTKAGLMARESLAAGSRHIYALAFPSNAPRNNNNGGYEFQYREATGGTSAAIYPATPQPQVNYPNTWLRLRREGDTFIGYSSVDGVWWAEFARKTLDLPDTIYFGLAVTSHTGTATTTAKVNLQNSRLQPWYYPSRNDCATCHNTNAGGFLGPKTRQLNGNLLYPNSVTDNQLRAWSHIGLFNNAPEESSIPGLDQLAALGDTGASLEKRARSYVDANCAQCHRPGGVHAFWDARFDTPLNSQGIIYGLLGNNLGDPLARVAVPQSLDHSIMYQRVNTVGGIQMPPLARNLVDQQGVDVLRQWIESLTPNTPPSIVLTSPAAGAVYYQSDPITLSAQASDADGIQKVEFYDGANKIGEDTTAPYAITWTGALSGSHDIIAVAIDQVGNNAASAIATITVLTTPILGWNHTDVGNAGVAGTADYQGGTFSIGGSGDDIWGVADAFHFVYRPFVGDGEMIARVLSLENTDGWAKSGVMMRETLDAGSTYAASLVSYGNGLAFQRRPTTNGQAVHTGGVNAGAPYWVRLVRAGNVFTAYSSPDGSNWTLIGSETIPMATTIYAGLAVTAHNNGVLNEAILDNVSFSNWTSTPLVNINFQPAASPTVNGYLVDSGLTYASRGNGFTYGWSRDNTADTRDRDSANSPDQRYDTFIYNQRAHGDGTTTSSWEIAVPNGTYSVHLAAGDPTDGTGTTYNLGVEGQLLLSGTSTAANHFLEASGKFAVTDGKLTFAPQPGFVNVNNRLSFVEIFRVTRAPIVTVTNPIADTSLYAPSFVALAADVTPGDQAVAKVEFLVDGTKIGEDTTSPYTFSWNSPTYGTHQISARAVDAVGSTGISTPVDLTINVPGVAGFRGEYYDNMDLTHLAFVRADSVVNFNYGNGSPDLRIGADTFSIRWSGRIRPRYSESYSLTTNTDDGVRLWVNGQLVINHWVDQGPTRYSAVIPMIADQEYDVVMEYYENGGGASAQLLWSSASQTEEPIPSSRTTVPTPPNSVPSIWLVTPTQNAKLLVADDVTISAMASDLDGSIAKVEFWADGSKLGEVTNGAYSWLWSGPHSLGSHTVWATAIDNGGASTTTAQTIVEVTSVSLSPISASVLTNPDRVAFTIQTTVPTGRSYSIEWSEDLLTWHTLQSGVSDGSPINLVDEAPGVSKRFYRMQVTD